MKDIDIINGIQHVGDDLITRAEDCLPMPKRSIKGYIAAAACMLLIVTAIPVVIARINYSGSFSSSVERLDADKYGRTFYNYWNKDWPDSDKVEAVDGTILLSPVLEELLALPHSSNDRFAVTISNIGSGSHELKDVYERFTVKYDENDIAKNDPTEFPTVYVTEEQLRSMEPLPDMCLAIVPIKRANDYVFFREDEDFIDNIKKERFSKFYGEIYLYYNEDDAIRTLGLNPDEASYQDPAVLAELERYYRKFAADYGIDPDKLFAGGVSRTFKSYTLIATGSPETDEELNFRGYVTDIVLYGEFETATAERMLRDKRVNFIMKTADGGYLYEEHGLWAYPTIVSDEQVSAISANMTYGEIVKMLGHTAQYGENSLHVYLADPGRAAVTSEYGLIILDFDNPNELCPYSGNELLSKAVHVEDVTNVLVSSDSHCRTNAVVLKDDLCLISVKNRLQPVRLDLEDIGSDNIFGFDERFKKGEPVPADEVRYANKDEVFRPGAELSINGFSAVYNKDFDIIFPNTITVDHITILN